MKKRKRGLKLSPNRGGGRWGWKPKGISKAILVTLILLVISGFVYATTVITNTQIEIGNVTIDENWVTTRYLNVTNTTYATGLSGATMVVAANDSKNKGGADYVCDGTADEVQIQEAIDALPSGGGKVLLLEGNYAINAQITIPSNAVLSGVGAGTKLTLNNNVNDRFIVNSDRTNGNTNIVIENLYIDGNKDGQSAIGPVDSLGNAGSLDFRNVTNLVIRSNTIINAWAAGVETTLCTNVIVSGNRIDNSADDGIGINDQSSFATVSNNIITNAGVGTSYGGPNGIEIQDGSHDITVSNNIIKNSYDSGIAVITHDGSTACYNIVIADNVVKDNTDPAIYVSGNDDPIIQEAVVIKGNLITHLFGRNYGISVRYSRNVVIADNIVKIPDPDKTGMFIGYNSSQILVEGNIFRCTSEEAGGGIGVYLYDVLTDCRFENNIIDGFNYFGIKISGNHTRLSITNNHIVGSGSGKGIYWDSPTSVDCIFRNNDIEGTDWSYDKDTTTYNAWATNWAGNGNKWDGGLLRDKIVAKYKNTLGSALAAGDIVVLKAYAAGDECTTTTAQGDDLVLGMALGTINDDAYGDILVEGKTVVLKVDGNTDIAIGDFIGTFTTAKIGMKAAAGDMAFAIALEAYTTDDSNGVIDAILITPRKI